MLLRAWITEKARPRDRRPHWSMAVLVALALSVLAMLASELVREFTNRTTYFLYLPPMIVASWYGGRIGGLACMFASLLLIATFVLVPRLELQTLTREDLAILVLFAVVSTIVVLATAGRKQADIERAAALREAEEARQHAELNSRLKDQFLATLSHELRTPLNAVLGWTSVLASGRMEPSKVPTALASIHRNAQAQKQLVDDLLDTSAIVSGRLRLEPAPMDLAEAARSAVDAVRLSIDARGHRLVQQLEPVRMLGDQTRLRQVVWNLLSNAVKFTPDGGTIELRVDAVDQDARITVRDSGRGITPDFLPHVFDLFRQADTSITRISGGLGLGLALVRHLVEAHGGRVSVESDGAGRGALFTVRLPIRQEHSSPGETAAAGAPHSAALDEPSMATGLGGTT